MLAELRVANLVLIEEVRLELSPAFNAFTGETGAGKSLLLDALGLLFGARGEPDLVRPGAQAAEVSARFILADRELVSTLEEELGIVFDTAGDRGQGLGDREPNGGRGDGKTESAECGVRSAARRRTAQGEKRGAEEEAAGERELVVSRILPRAGRARAYANGRPIALAALKELGNRLVDLHGQHENQSLLRHATRLEILDRFAEGWDERAACRQAHQDARRAAEQLADLRRAARDKAGREDLYRFQQKELEEAKLDALDPEALESELKLLRGAEAIRGAVRGATEQLDGEEGATAAGLLARALKGLENLGDAGAETAALTERLHALLAETRELARDLGALAEKAQSDPERLAEIEDRRARLRTLERKHGRYLPALVALRDELRGKLSDLSRLEVRTEECEGALAQAVERLRAAAAKLSRKRKQAARDLERRVAPELEELGLKGAVLKVVLTPHGGMAEGEKRGAGEEETRQGEDGETGGRGDEETRRNNERQGEGGDDEAARLMPARLRPSGAEGLELLFSANPELPPRPLAECASGGELSRVMLALKGVLARAHGADRLPVVVFDEVDSGVGGRTGSVLGRKLAALAAVRQVLCVTHLPQLAAYARQQMKVEKQRRGATGVIGVKLVEGRERVEELAVMLRGEAATERTRAEAEEMLRAAQAEVARQK
jgi:DNA repair protein RecN (Recombination protein N)